MPKISGFTVTIFAITIASTFAYRSYKKYKHKAIRKDAISLYNNGKYKESLLKLSYLLKCSTNDPNLTWYILKCNFYINNYLEAISQCRMFLCHSPENFNVRKILYECCLKLGLFEEAFYSIFCVLYMEPSAENKSLVNRMLEILSRDVLKKIIGEERGLSITRIRFEEYFETFPLLFSDFRDENSNFGDWEINGEIESSPIKDYFSKTSRKEHQSNKNIVEDKNNVLQEPNLNNKEDDNLNNILECKKNCIEDNIEEETKKDAVIEEKDQIKDSKNALEDLNDSLKTKKNWNKSEENTQHFNEELLSHVENIAQSKNKEDKKVEKNKIVNIKVYKTGDGNTFGFMKYKLKEKSRRIHRKTYQKIKSLVGEFKINELEEYVKFKNDSLSIFIKASLNYLKRNIKECRAVTQGSSEIEYSDNNCKYASSTYERKIYTYIHLIKDFIDKKDRNYVYEDVSTHFYKMLLQNASYQMHLEEVMKNGIHSFIYYELLKNNSYFVEEAYMLFPSDCKILFLSFEVFIGIGDYEKADFILKSINKYFKDDPRSDLCNFYKISLAEKDNFGKQEYFLLQSLKKDGSFSKTNMLLGRLYSETDIEKSILHLERAIADCVNENELVKIIEMLYVQKAKLKIKEILDLR